MKPQTLFPLLLIALAATLTTALPNGSSGSGSGSDSGGGGGGAKPGGRTCAEAGVIVLNRGGFAGTCSFATQSCTQKNGVTGSCIDGCPCDGLGCFVDPEPAGNLAICTGDVFTPPPPARMG